MTTEQIVIAGTETAITAFAYDALDSETRIVVRQKTTEIRERVDAMQRSTIEIGQRLREVKARLRHGEWGDWLQSEFRWSDQTALNMINVAVLAEQTPKILEFEDRFAKSALTAIASPSTPPAARQAALELAESGEKVTSAKAQQLITQHKPALVNDDGAPHLPPDFAAAQARAKKLNIYVSMSSTGHFTFTYETGARAVAGTADSWPQALDLLTKLEIEATKPPPAQAQLPGVSTGDEEIAAAAPAPPAPPPITLTPLPPALPGLASAKGVEAHKLLVSKRMLLQAALHLIEAELEQAPGPLISFPAERALEAARLFIVNPALGGAAAMLAFSATVVQSEASE